MKKTARPFTKYTSTPVVVSSSLDGTILDVNAGFTKLTGFNPKEVISKNASEIQLWKVPSLRNELIRKAKSGEEVSNEPAIVYTKSGEELPIRISMTVLKAEETCVVISVAFVSDHNPQPSRTSKKRNHILLQDLPVPPSIRLNPPDETRLSVADADGVTFVRIADIMYFKASGNYTEIYIVDGRRLIVSRLLNLYEQLVADYDFVRIHHSTIVHLKYVEKYIRYDGGYVILTDKTPLPISRRKREEFLKSLKNGR